MLRKVANCSSDPVSAPADRVNNRTAGATETPEGCVRGSFGMRPLVSRPLLLAWGVLGLAVGATLTLAHAYSLPQPDRGDASLQRAIADLRRSQRPERWLAAHFLYPRCRCSQRISEHLLSDPRPDDVKDVVVLIGHDPELEERFRRQKIAVQNVEPEALHERFGVEAVPLLVVSDPNGTLRYVGGYTERKQGPLIRDAVILAELQRDDTSPTELPLYGCPATEELRRVRDPLGLR